MGETWDRVTVRMPEAMIDDLDDAVDETDVPSRSDLIRRCVRQGGFGP